MRESFVHLQFKRKKGKLLVDGRESAHDVRIIEAVARAMYWHDLLDTGTFKSVAEIARAEGLMPTTVGRLLRLTLLAPEVIERLVGAPDIVLERVIRRPWPNGWGEQNKLVVTLVATGLPAHD